VRHVGLGGGAEAGLASAGITPWVSRLLHIMLTWGSGRNYQVSILWVTCSEIERPSLPGKSQKVNAAIFGALLEQGVPDRISWDWSLGSALGWEPAPWFQSGHDLDG
jgi:hypothetical protein